MKQSMGGKMKKLHRGAQVRQRKEGGVYRGRIGDSAYFDVGAGRQSNGVAEVQARDDKRYGPRARRTESHKT